MVVQGGVYEDRARWAEYPWPLDFSSGFSTTSRVKDIEYIFLFSLPEYSFEVVLHKKSIMY